MLNLILIFKILLLRRRKIENVAYLFCESDLRAFLIIRRRYSVGACSDEW